MWWKKITGEVKWEMMQPKNNMVQAKTYNFYVPRNKTINATPQQHQQQQAYCRFSGSDCTLYDSKIPPKT